MRDILVVGTRGGRGLGGNKVLQKIGRLEGNVRAFL